MGQGAAETFVKIYAILFWIGAIGTVIVGGALLIGSSTIAALMPLSDAPAWLSGMLGTLLIVGAILLIAMGIVYFLVGRGLWNRKSWARIAAIILCALSIFSFPIGTIIGGFGIYLFGFEENVKRLFGASTAEPAKKGKK